MESRHYVRIGVESNADATVTQAFTNYLWMDTLLEHKADMSMAEVVEPESR